MLRSYSNNDFCECFSLKKQSNNNNKTNNRQFLWFSISILCLNHWLLHKKEDHMNDQINVLSTKWLPLTSIFLCISILVSSPSSMHCHYRQPYHIITLKCSLIFSSVHCIYLKTSRTVIRIPSRTRTGPMALAWDFLRLDVKDGEVYSSGLLYGLWLERMFLAKVTLHCKLW